MVESQPSVRTSNRKGHVNFWMKILSTQYLIRHGFLKSFTLPMVIAQISSNANFDQWNHFWIIYVLIALHFLSGICVSDRRFRHALGFLPHLIALGWSSYFSYFHILRQVTPWFRIRGIIQALGTVGIFAFISSLHTSNNHFRTILRRFSSFLTVFYFVFNAYILWWSDDLMKLFSNNFWKIFIRFHSIFSILVSGGFCLDQFLIQSCQCALYLISSQIVFDLLIMYSVRDSNVYFWLSIDFLIDNLALLCGYFYFYQFNLHQKMKK